MNIPIVRAAPTRLNSTQRGLDFHRKKAPYSAVLENTVKAYVTNLYEANESTPSHCQNHL